MRRALHEFCVKFTFDLADLLADGRLRPSGFTRDRGERAQTLHVPQGHQNLRFSVFVLNPVAFAVMLMSVFVLAFSRVLLSAGVFI